MKAPDKIYIDDLAVVNDSITKISLEQLPNFSEYIRKDALLEWIQEARTIPHENAIIRDLTFQEVINKLNSM